jgi:hypothetical protein
MRTLCLLLSLSLAGCSHTSVQGGWGGSNSPGGSGVSWVLINIGLIAAWDYSERQRLEGAPPLNEPPLELDKGRRVNAQDCTQPIRDWSANLKCK